MENTTCQAKKCFPENRGHYVANACMNNTWVNSEKHRFII